VSIYATLGSLKFARCNLPFVEDDWVEVVFQGVPGHIGHSRDYPEGDPYSSFLPPAIEDEGGWRAVLVVQRGTPKGTSRSSQEYVDPLLVLSGDEWDSARFVSLLERIELALRERSGRPRTLALFSGPDGTATELEET
jgi:hypothetical protein